MKSESFFKACVDKLNEIKKLTLMNDAFMKKCLEGNIPCVQAMINCLIPDKKLIVNSVEIQKELPGLGRSVRLDVLAKDEEGRLYNIEIQKRSEGASELRVRFYFSMIDAHTLKAGEDFSKLPEVYVIFITERDIFGRGQVLYNFHWTDDDTHERFDTKQHAIFLNCSAKDDGSNAWKLAHDMTCIKPDEMFIPELAERTRYFKEDSKGVRKMNEDIHEIVREFYKDDLEEESKRSKADVFKKFLDAGKMTIEEIADVMKMSLSDVQAIMAADMHG